jgi:hypothetical protein
MGSNVMYAHRELPAPRSLTAAEQSIVAWLIEHGDAQHASYRFQISDLTVISHCKCGCPTVNFAYKGEHPTRIGGSPICDFQGEVEGMGVGVMLFAAESHITSLEVYSFAGHDEPFGLPTIESLRALDF